MPTKVSYMDITPISDSTKEANMNNKTAIKTIIIAVIAILTVNLISCAAKTSGERKAMAVHSPAFSKINAAADMSSEIDDEYKSWKKLHDCENYEKSDVPNMSVTVFGKEYEMMYDFSQRIFIRGCGVDIFRYNDESNLVYAQYNDNTGNLVGISFYPHNTHNRKTDFVAPINENSSEKDYLDLARSMILEYTGVDCGEWEYDVDTYIYHTTYNYSAEDWKSGFMNFIKDDPEFDAEYTFRFYKTLSGLHRGDDVRAVIRNDGTVLEVRGEVYDEAFAPFADVKIDAEELFRRVDGNYSAPGPEVYHRTRLTAIPAEDGLWVEASIKGIYYDEEGVPQWDDVNYAAKVAEYKDAFRETNSQFDTVVNQSSIYGYNVNFRFN